MAAVKTKERKSHFSKIKKEKPKLAIKGWLTTDEDEIARRRERALLEKIRVENLEPKENYFSTFITHSQNGSNYYVEIRSLADRINSCDCPDHQSNNLGTCKHIEAVLAKLKKKGKRRFKQTTEQGSTKIEIYADFRHDRAIKVSWPKQLSKQSRAYQLVHPFFSTDNHLLGSTEIAFPSLQRAILHESQTTQNQIRISRHIENIVEESRCAVEKKQAKQNFLTDVEEGKRSLDVVKFPLYPYQQDGILHLAFNERAILADEMGLGKTVQAIAACELLRRLKGIEKVLVVATASLKAEWEEQISKFIGLETLIIQGARAERLRQYQYSSFFYLANYEQIMRDASDINRLLFPDVIILDEAQRIKNWQTKTATAVKKLSSRYAFVLTGTPLENKIDDIYSVTEFLNPRIFGPLFQFNRDFYQLDERGKPTGYKNLDELHRRLHPILLRRLKSDVEGELPERIINNYFVEMSREQYIRYSEYESYVASLLRVAKKRPLLKEEHEKLQKWLSCMRMLCDTPYILDEDCRISPKLDELKNILEELLDEPETKIIIFSEWARMLQLVRELAQKLGIGAAWHTGSVPQKKRRHEINRFKEDSHCRLFLSTDSGSVGLNLQVANVVINLDLPWNPAKLEQRIARAWRKHQMRSVQVINLICENSIEHRMLSLLNQKQLMAQTVLHADTNVKEMELPSGRAAFIERMNELLGNNIDLTKSSTQLSQQLSETNFWQTLREDALARFEDNLELLEVHQSTTGQQTVLAVSDHSQELKTTLQKTMSENNFENTLQLEILDQTTYETIQRLIKAGIISINSNANVLHRSKKIQASQQKIQDRFIIKAQEYMQRADRSLRMANLLVTGDFHQEAVAPIRESLVFILKSFAWIKGEVEAAETDLSETVLEKKLIQQYGLSPETLILFSALNRPLNSKKESQIQEWLASTQAIYQQINKCLIQINNH